ncbi:MAG: DUF1080 domain-containing protein [Gemmatimonadota bacterium]|nr:DUF1080 domain-containing protein [Gemmatimonadota bacterium]
MRRSYSRGRIILTALAACLAAALIAGAVACAPAEAPEAESESPAGDGYIDLLSKHEGKYNKHGWNHFGEGHFTIDHETGVLSAHSPEGSGLIWYSAAMFQDFVLELDFMVDDNQTNSGIFLRIPYMVENHDYIHDSFEIQIFDNERAGMTHYTGAIYDASPPLKKASRSPGQWNHFKITCQGQRMVVELNGELVNDWTTRPTGKIKTHWPKGYIGLQNHRGPSDVHFRNIRVKEL